MKRFLALALAMLMVLSLVACGGDGGTSSAPDASKSGTSSNTQQDNANQGTVDTNIDTNVNYKKELVVAAHGASNKIDPQTGSSFNNTTLYQLVYDRLAYYNPTTQEITPMLATEWSVSDDGLTWTFKLREDVTFHNGEKFTADDVVFTWERGKGSDEVNVKKYYNSIVNCVADGDYTVKMTLDSANADFVFWLTFPYMCVLDRKTCETDPDNGYLIGTGLWKWEKHEANDYDSFVRNDNYWGETTPTEHLTFRYIPEASARLIALENGELDVAYNVATTEVDYVRQNSDLELIVTDQVTLQYMNFNMAKEGVTQDANFRLAVAHAIDWDSLIQGVKNGYATRATTVWSHAQFGYAPQGGYDYDVEKAKEYLSKSSYNGETVKITGSSGYSTACLIIMDMLTKIGMKVEFVEIGSGNFVTDIKAGDWEMVVYQLSFAGFGSDFVRLLGTTNGGFGIINAPNKDKIYEVCDKALVASSDAERKELYAEAQKLMFEDACFIPLFYPQAFTGIRKGVTGVLWAANTDFDYRYVKVPEA